MPPGLNAVVNASQSLPPTDCNFYQKKQGFF